MNESSPLLKVGKHDVPSKEKRKHMDVDYDYVDPHVNFGGIGKQNRSRSMLSFGKTNLSWTQVSNAIGESLDMHLKGALQSMRDQPSQDRASSGILMGVNLQSMILGTSVLSIPFCVKIAGIWGLAMIVILGVFSMFTADILSDCQHQLSYSTPGYKKRVYVSFVEMANECWKRAGSYIMKSFVYLSLARNVVVIILLTDIADDILRSFGFVEFDKKLLSVVWTVAVIPLLYITKVSLLAWVSFIGLNLYIMVISTVFILCLLTVHTWNLSDINLYFDLKGLGIAIGIITNSYAAHMNLPALEGSLKYPQSYRKTTVVSFALNVIAKLGFAVCGYLTYVDKTEQEITSNINKYYPLPLLLRIAVMFFSYFTIPLQSFVVFELIDNTFKPKFLICGDHKYIWLFLSRTLFMTLCLFVAVIIPDFSIVVSLIGSVRGCMVTLILPSLFYIKLRTHDCSRVKMIICYFTIIFGILAALLGVFSSAMAIADGLDSI